MYSRLTTTKSSYPWPLIPVSTPVAPTRSRKIWCSDGWISSNRLDRRAVVHQAPQQCLRRRRWAPVRSRSTGSESSYFDTSDRSAAPRRRASRAAAVQRRRATFRMPCCAPSRRSRVPSSTFSPCAMMHTESQMRLGVVHHVGAEDHRLARAACSSTTVSLSACALIGSRPLNGSSRITRSGSCSSVRDELHLLLHAARQFVDLRVAPVLLGGARLEALEPFVDAPRRRPRRARPSARRGSAARAAPASSCTARAPRAGSRRGRALRVACRVAEERDRPESGSMMSRIMRMVVVLPAPLGPSRPYTVPRGT